MPLAFHRRPPARVRGTARPVPGPRQAFVRRRGDRSQAIRTGSQLLFAATAAAVGVQFWMWVRHYESGGQTLRVARPPGVEAWLPLASLMNLKALVLTGELPPAHAAGLFMLTAFLGISWLLRKSFCSWICPIGTLSQWLWQGGEAMFGRTLTLPRPLDVPLRSLKYLLFGFFFYVAVVALTVPEIRAFLESPYGAIADVKMMDFFRRMGTATAVVLVLLVVLSVAIRNFWCRYLCPYGAMTGLFALLSPSSIRRDPASCIDCAKCAKACPAGLPVDTALRIRSAECTACMACVAVCPAAGALDLTIGLPRRRHRLSPWSVATLIAVIFFGTMCYARAIGVWHTQRPDTLYFELVPRAAEFTHPR